MLRILLLVAVALTLGSLTITVPPARGASRSAVPPVLDFKMPSLTGQEVDLSRYQGQVVMMVNTASRCGFTPQYKGLEALYQKYHAQGFTILGFPANNFLWQEPGTNAEIGAFCQKNYGVTFDMFAKISVRGSDKAPLYKFLTDDKTDPKFSGEIHWNFTKFLVGRDGQIVARFGPPVAPDAKEVVSAIEAALAHS
jgi:glutathione peroxidase